MGRTGARDSTPATIIATLVRINPYGEVYTTIRNYDTKGQVFSLFNFVLDEEGDVISLDEDKNSIVMNRNGAGE